MAEPLPPGLISLVELQGLNPAYRVTGPDGKADTAFLTQFNTLIQQLVDSINAVIIAYNAAIAAQLTADQAIARSMAPQIPREVTQLPPLGLSPNWGVGSGSNPTQGLPPFPLTAAPAASRGDDRAPLPLMILREAAGDQMPRQSLGERSLALPETVTLGASPYSFQAPSAGTVVITAGTGLAVVFTRDGSTFIALPDASTMQVAAGDVITVTYLTPPAMTFIEG